MKEFWWNKIKHDEILQIGVGLFIAGLILLLAGALLSLFT